MAFPSFMTFITVVVLYTIHTVAEKVTWANQPEEDFEFQCPLGQHISAVSIGIFYMKHDPNYGYQCRVGFVGDNCYWTDPSTFGLQHFALFCGEDEAVTGIKAEVTTPVVLTNIYAEDRNWSFRCCKTSSKKRQCTNTVSFTESFYLDHYFDLEVPFDKAITGATSAYVQVPHLHRYGRLWVWETCSFDMCQATGFTILDDIPIRRAEKKVIGIAAGLHCHSDSKQTLTSRRAVAFSQSASFTITSATASTFSQSLTAKVGMKALNFEFLVSHTSSSGDAHTFSTANGTTDTSASGSWSLGSISFGGPGAAIILGEVTEYFVDASDVNVEIDLTCSDGTSRKERSVVRIQSRTFGHTHISSKFAEFTSAENCGTNTPASRCVSNIDGSLARDKAALFDAFEECFQNGVGIVLD